MVKGLYELCGDLGELVRDIIIDETLKQKDQIARLLADDAFSTLPHPVKQHCLHRRVYHTRMPVTPPTSISVFVIEIMEDSGKVHRFTAERLRDAG